MNFKDFKLTDSELHKLQANSINQDNSDLQNKLLHYHTFVLKLLDSIKWKSSTIFPSNNEIVLIKKKEITYLGEYDIITFKETEKEDWLDYVKEWILIPNININ